MKTDGYKLLWGSFFILAPVICSSASLVLWGSGPGTNAPPAASNTVAIAAGSSHCLALLPDSTVISWGNNAYSQTNVPEGLSNVVAVSGGFYHSMALKSDGTVTNWGRNTHQQSTVP